MHSTALLSIKDLKAFSKCAQLCSIIFSQAAYDMSDHSVQIAKRIIRKEGDVNFLIPSDCSVRNQDIQDGTMLHIAWKSGNSEILEDLLNLGADFTIKNKHGDTALHCAFKKYSSENNELSKNQDHSHIKTMLSAHIKFANSSNPCDKNGLSHFHIACMVNSAEVVEFFLMNGVCINQTIDNEEKQYPGFTPLHCAVNCCSMETIEVLFKYGADRILKNSYGMTPLQQLLNQKMELFGGEKIKEALANRVKAIDVGIFLFLGNNFFDKKQIIDNTGLSSFHIACTMQDLSKVENLLEQVKDNHCVKMESPVWPGYTALHFAAHCNNIQVIKLLHRRGASIDVKNVKGLSALDICLKIGHIEDLHAAISLKPEWANILFSDNKTRLVNFLSAMQYTTKSDDFLRDNVDDINMKLPNNSPVWPGCTPLHQDHAGQTALHLAAQFKNEKAILALLNVGADLNIADSEGKSAFSCGDTAEVYYIFEKQILKLEYFGLTVSQFNNDNMSRSKYASIHNDRFHSEIETAKSLAIGELQLTLGDFLSESNAVVKYSRMSDSSRDVIDKYFESNCMQFIEILSILKLQYRKAVTRFRMVETVSTMKDFVGFALPALCADNILRFFSIADLKNIVAAINFKA